MGIKDIKPFLKSKEINCNRKIPLHMLKGEKIAVDALNWIFTYIMPVGKTVVSEQEDILEPICQEKIYTYMIDECAKFNAKFIDHDITPIWIWDGVSQDNKTATKVERKKSKQVAIDKMTTLREQLLAMNPFERPPELMEMYRKMVSKNIHIKRATIDKIKLFTQQCGLPCITSKDEAENLGSSLCCQKRIKAIWSADTDTYPLGAQLVIKGFEYETINNQTVISINGTFTSIIRKELELSHQEFRDFCIMLGTDFNERMPGIGPKKSYTLIKKYRNIEKIEEETKHNTYCLKHEEVRKQLSPYDTSFVDDKDLEYKNENVEIDEKLKENFNVNSLIVKIKNK